MHSENSRIQIQLDRQPTFSGMALTQTEVFASRATIAIPQYPGKPAEVACDLHRDAPAECEVNHSPRQPLRRSPALPSRHFDSVLTPASALLPVAPIENATSCFLSQFSRFRISTLKSLVAWLHFYPRMAGRRAHIPGCSRPFGQTPSLNRLTAG